MGKMAGYTEKSFYLADETIEGLTKAMGKLGKPGRVLVDFSIRKLLERLGTKESRAGVLAEINRIFPDTHAHRNPRRRPQADE
jgi:hypothetical protein